MQLTVVELKEQRSQWVCRRGERSGARPGRVMKIKTKKAAQDLGVDRKLVQALVEYLAIRKTGI